NSLSRRSRSLFPMSSETAKLISSFSKDDAALLDDAVDYFTQRIRANPKDDVAYAYRAWVWKLKGELGISMKDNDEAIRLAPTRASWWHNRGILWNTKK